MEEATQELIGKAKAGDLDAFGRIVLQHESGVRAYLAVRMNDPAGVDDLAQEVFITAFRRLESFDASKPIGPWLRGIAMNLLRNLIRKHTEAAAGGSEELDALLDARIDQKAESRGAGNILEALRLCLTTLEGKARELVHWRYEEELEMGEVTRRLGCKHSAATMMLSRIRRQLKDCVELRLARDVHP